MSTEDLFSQREGLTPAKLGLLQKRLEQARQQREQAKTAAVPSIPHREDEGPAPVSFAQQRLWFIDQLEPGTTIYNKANAVRLTGRLNVDVLAATFTELFRRHESLRTVFINNGGQPLQVVNPPQPVTLSPIDFSGRDKDDREMLVQYLINEEAALPFDLLRGPVARVSLFRLAPDDHVAIFTMHHIISDGWSIGVMVREVAALYAAFSSGRKSPLPELPIQYSDFAVWQREWLQGEVLEKQLQYWKDQLRNMPAMLELPTDRPRSSVMTHRGARHHMKFPAGLPEALKELSKRENVTLFMTLLAVWNTLLARYSRMTDIVVGTTVANRTRSELEKLIGFFVNTLVIRTDLSGDPSFRELLERVREVSLGAFAHQDLPFEKLVEELQPERSMNHTPLFQVTFGLENTPASELSLPGLTLSPVEQKNDTAIFDLSAGFFERGNAIHGLIEYSTDLFDPPTIDRLVRHLTMVMESVVADVTRPISSIPLLTEADQQQVLVEWNRTTTNFPRDNGIHELFEQQAAANPEAVALIFGEREVSYGELNAKANQLAHYLRGQGVGPEVLVGLMVERSVEMIVGLLGILKAGGAYVPLDPQYPIERLAFMIEDAQVPVLLTQEHLVDNLPSHWGTVLCLDSEWDAIDGESDQNLENRITAENLAYVIYTSGSTGRPKGVCVTHRGVVRVVRDTNYARLDHDEVFLQMAPISFDASTFEIWAALLNGARLVIFPPQRPSLEDIAATLRRYQITTLWITTGLFHVLVERQIDALKGLRQIITGGDVMIPAMAEKVLREVPACQSNNMYGPTEATTFTTFYPMVASELGSNVSIGKPISNTDVYVLDEHMNPVGIGMAGELFIGGDGLARAYLRRAELTAERFVPHPFSEVGGARLYRTGDVVRYLDDGRIEFIGRADGQVKVRGFRVELGEIEAALREHPGLKAAIVEARREADGERQMVGYVVSANGEAIPGSQIREWLRQRMPDYMVPNIFVSLDELPLTPNGKIDRKALPDPAVARQEESREYVAPRSAVEEVLAGIWAEVLKVEQVSVHENFFELGGHSLLATQVISRVRETFKIEIPLIKLFDQPTVAGFATNVEVELSKAAGLTAPPIERVSREQPLPLSFAQQRLWFIDQLQPGSAAYNTPTAVRLTGKLNLEVTRRTFTEVVRRHEALRTTFAARDGQPVQVVHEPGAFEIPLTDLSEVAESEREGRVRALAMAEAQRPFDLQAGPLLRVSLLRLAEEDHVALFTMHHIVSDGWSIGILVKEVAALYGAYLKGEESPLPELPVQYGDFAAWQRNWLQGEVLERQLGYWTERLRGAPPALELPTDRPRPTVMTQRGAQHGFRLSHELSRGLQELSRREGVTLFMVLLGAFALLLKRYTGQEDVVVGSPIAGRNRGEVEGLIGFFVNTLVLRTDVSGDPTFRELLERVKEVALGAYAHQDLPFEKLVEELQPERSLAHTPLFQVMLVLQNAPGGELELPGLKLSPLDGGSDATPGGEGVAVKFELTVTMFETREGLRGSVSYNRDLFEGTTIERMMRHWTRLLEAVLGDATQRLSQLPMMTSAEREELLVEWNDTATEYARELSVAQLFEQQVERDATALALISGAERVSYGELNERANRLAHYLRARGVGAETFCGVYLERGVEMIVALLAVLKAGGAYVPLDPMYPSERIGFILEETNAPLVLTQTSLAATLPESAADTICVDQEAEVIARESSENPLAETEPEQLAYVLYTSGSTGRPKGVAITHHSAVAMVQWALQTYTPAQFAGTLASTSICFDLSVYEIFAPLSCGGAVIVAENALALPHLPAAGEVTLINTVPSAMAELVRMNAVPISVEVVNLAGEALSRELVRDVYQHTTARQVWNLYGPSEDTTYSTFAPIDAGSSEKPAIGKPIHNTRAFVLDEQMEPVAPGTIGELYLAGEGLARGYLGRPEMTAERFVPDPFAVDGGGRLYRTGDLVRYRAGGELEYMGRADHQVKIRGFRIELGEIEAALRSHESVQDAVVVVKESDGDKRLVGYVVGADGEAVAGASLREWLRQRLPDYMVPSVFVPLDELPLTPNGKVDRRSLPDPTFARPEEREFVAPRNAVEEVLSGIWAEVLKVEQVSVHDNFFELGGHSLLATQLMSRVRTSFAVELPLRALFQQPTVAGLALSIESARMGEQELAPPIVRVSREEPLPLSFAQQRLWFIDQLQPGSGAYNIPTAVRLTGKLNLEVTQRTFAEVVRRHEALRTTFAAPDGQPVQVVHEAGAFEIPITDLSEVAESEREGRVRALAMAEAQRPFDLQSGPLLRVSLLRLAEEDHVALFTMHHIVSDGWSMGILVREVAALYGAYLRGEESPLPELPVQYGDFAAWQREWLQGEVLERQLGYWTERLRGAPPALELPTDRPRPTVMTQRGAQHGFRLSHELSRGLQELSRREGVTLFMVLLGAFALLLKRYTGQEDVVVGSPIAGRNRGEVEGLIGFFVNTLVLRTDVSGDPTFRELLERVKEVALGAYAHQDLPFEKLVEELQPERSLAHTPLFQVMLVLQNAPGGELELPGLKLTPIGGGESGAQAMEGGAAKFELTLTVIETREGLRGSVNYNRDLFDVATIERMMRHWTRVLEAVVGNATQRLSRVGLLSGAERDELLVKWNDTATEYPREMSVAQLFEQEVERDRARVALAWGAGSESRFELSYGELNERANRLAHYLRARGVGAETLVGVYLERSTELVVALLAVVKAGGAYVPLDPQYPSERLSFILEQTQAPVVLTRASLVPGLPQSAATTICVDTDEAAIAHESAENLGHEVEREQLVYVLYTSGSTGQPKGVAVTHGGLVNYLQWAKAEYLRGGEGAPLHSTIGFDLTVTSLYLPLLNGERVLLVPEEQGIDSLRETLRDQSDFSLVKLTPAHLQLLSEQVTGAEAQQWTRTLVIGGEALTAEQISFWRTQAPQVRLINEYGPTETVVGCAVYEVTPETTSSGAIPIGRPIANTELYLLDEQLDTVPVGAVGELYIGGEGVARGYLGRPDLTAAQFVPHPFAQDAGARLYRTGDLARYRANGELEFLGRADGQVKIRGYRIELGEIEAALRGHEGVQDAVVVVHERAGAAQGTEGDKRLVGYVVGADGEAVNSAALREWLRQRLPDYMVPSVFVPLDEMPLTPNGKVDRRSLPDPTFARPEEREFVAPRNAVEEVLSGIWAEVLKVEQVSVHDNFFELGGHSLLATQLMSRVRTSFAVELPLRALFQQPTVAGLALSIESARMGEQELAPPIVRVSREEPLPLSFAQQRLWFIDQLQPGSGAYNIPTAVRLTGKLNLEVTQRTFAEVVRRHEALRTTFAAPDGQPVQVVHEAGAFEIPITDLSEVAESEREGRVRALAMAEAQRPFDLQSGPLLRVSLLRLAEEDHVALFTMHHIVSDGWSMGILVREVAALYGAYLRGEESPLPELPVQYGDFAAWQREWLQGEVLERQLGYWTERLRGAPPALELPTDRPRPTVMTQRGAQHGFRLSHELSRGLQELSRREGVTLFMVLLGAFALLLKRYTGQEDVVVGSPIAGRNRGEVEGLIGFFVNTLVLRTDVSGDPTFRELLERVKEVALGAYAHQDLPFEKLVEELQPERSLAHTPLFQVMLVLQNAPGGELELPGLKLTPIGGGGDGSSPQGMESGAAKFELTLTVLETREGLRGSVNYNRDLFDVATIERMMRHWTRVLEAVAGDATQRLSRVALLSGAERDELLVKWNDTATEYPRELSVAQLFEQEVERDRARVALAWGAGSESRFELSYGELNERANRLAHYLRARGVGAETLVGVYLERSTELVVALLAVVKAGGAYVPLDPQYPSERLSFILEQTQAPVVLTRASLVGGLPPSVATTICVDTDEAAIANESAANVEQTVEREQLVYVLYTSGSTGQPKGVAVTHGGLVNYLQWAKAEYLRGGDGAPLHSTIGFDLTVTSLYLPLLNGERVLLVPEEQGIDSLRDTLRDQNDFSLVKLTPAHLQLLSEQVTGAEAQQWTRTLVIGGEALTAEQVSFWRTQAPQVRLINEYGPTETVVGCTVYEVTPETTSSGAIPIGRPIANTELYLLDEQLDTVPVGAVGELYIGGEGVARGYLGRPDLTAAQFVPHPFAREAGARLYRTGDLARYRANGELEFLGRADGQVKIRGYRIELGEIEAALRGHEGVQDAVVVVHERAGGTLAVPNSEGDKLLIAYLVGADGETVASAPLREWLRQRLPDYMVPSVFVSLDELPLTPNGKVDRKALPEPDLGPSIDNFVAPRDNVEMQLAKIWSEVLNVESVGVRDDFFDLGGHSMIATRMMYHIEQVFSRKIPLAALFESPTVEHLAKLLRDQTETQFSSLVQIHSGAETKTPIFFAHPSGGNILCYAELARHMGPDQPIYGLQAQGLDKDRTPHTTIEEMAAYYVNMLRSVQPEGPYFLVGWSMGGIVAFEMAQQLKQQGQEVAKLALIDVLAPATGKLRSLSQPLQKAWSKFDKEAASRLIIHFAQDIGLNLTNITAWRDQLEALKPDEQLAWVISEAKRYQILPPDMSEADSTHLFEVFRTNVYARQNYIGNTLHGRARLFIAEERFLKSTENPTTGWAKLIPDGLDYEAVPGDHYTMIRKPNARVLAERLRIFFDQVS